MASLGSLVIELAANTARLQSDLGRGVSMVERGAATMKRAFGFLSGGLAAGLGGGFFGRVASDAIKFGDEIQKAASRAGIGAGEFSKLAAAGKQVDIEQASLSRGIKNLQVAISNAANGSKQAQDSFRELGLEIGELRNIPADRQLEKIASALQRVTDPTDRTRLGTELLSKAYLELVPLLDKGAVGIRDLIREQERLGNTFSDAQIAKLAETDEAIKKLESSWRGFSRTLTAFVAPALTAVFEAATREESADSLRTRLESIEHGYDEVAKAALRAKLAQAEQREAQEQRDKRLAAISRGPGFAPLVAEEKRIADLKRQQDATRDLGLAKIDLERKEQKLARTMQENRELYQDSGLEEFARELEKPLEEFDLIEIQQRKVFKIFENSTDRMSVFADQAARNMQDAFADFLFDPFENGVKGMLKGFVDILRRMVAEAAAAQIFGKLFGGNGGLGGKLGGLLGGGGSGLMPGEWDWLTKRFPKIPGFASGGSFTVGGRSGTDANVVAFRATRGERVDVTPPGGSSGMIVNINLHQDNRGASVEFMRLLPARDRALIQQAKTELVDEIARRKYSALRR